ncbi:MAG: ATP-binding protein [Geobacteraceae bacterium]|nr:ATP-binding protein [Geobacteraceae bacterium]
MKTRIQWKLMVSYLALVVLIGVVIYLYLGHSLKTHLTAEIRDNLVNEARLVKIMAAKEIRVMDRDGFSLARTAGREIKARVSIINDKGTVVGDSELSVTGVRALENHAGRPEIRQALAGEIGTSIRYSSTFGTDMLYVAIPFHTESAGGGVVRLALPLSSLEKAVSGMHAMLGAALALAVFFSLLLSYLFSSFISRPLRSIASMASRIGRGDFSCRIPVAGRDEIGELASVMNDMAGKIESQLERISAEKNRLDTILRGMGEGVIVTDENGILTVSNPAFRSIFALEGYEEGKSLIEITRHPEMCNTLRRVLQTREDIVEETVLRLPEEKQILVHWVPLIEDGILIGAVAVFHDISELKALERIRKDFVANVSHELRTPVAVIKGYAETLLCEGSALTPEKTAQFVGIIHNHSERLANLITDLLTLSRTESGVLSMEPMPTNIESAVNRAVRLLDQKWSVKGIDVTIDDSLGDMPVILADQVKLEQVLVNLLDNAIKFTPANGSITISASDIGTHVKVDVNDTGCGIPPQDLQRIFERFYRVDTARSRELGGTGLGLSIVKHIVQAHGGTVSVESTPGKGSTFSFTLRKPDASASTKEP